MSDIETTDWSETAANNIQPSPNGWPPNSSPNIVYTTDRETMGALKRDWNRRNPTATSGGSANVQTLTYSVGPTAYVRGQRFCFIVGFANTGTVTLNVNGLGAIPMQANNVLLTGGELAAGGVVEVVYDGANFQIIGGGGGFLPITGGAVKGPFTVAANAGNSVIEVSKAASGGASSFVGATALSVRWNLQLGDTALETGSPVNTGSNCTISRYDDTGTYIDTPVSILRVNGQMTLSTPLRAQGYNTRNGTSGSYGGNNFNLYYTGSATQLWIDALNLGNITVSSDYRIKRDIAPLPSMWERVKALKPISYRLRDYSVIKGDDVERWGFVAHELQETLTEDAANGKKGEENVIQAPNLMVVVASLTKALQEAMARIEKLEARLPLAPETA